MTEDIRDIRGPIVEAAGTPWWPYLVAALVAIAAVLGVRAYLRARRKPLPADVRALRELAATRELIARDDPHGFSVRVSHAVRGYVEQAFAVHAPRRTTEELLADLLRDGSPVAPYRAELGAFLEHCDLAKYARWQLSRTDMTKLVESAEQFVRATAAPARGPA